MEVRLDHRKVALFMRQTWPKITESGGALPGKVVVVDSDSASKDGSITVFPDKDRNSLVFHGTHQQLLDMRAVVMLFDVQPMKVTLNLVIADKQDGVSSKFSCEIENNTEWTSSDSTTNLNVALTPRINADGSITVAAKVKRFGKEVRLVERAKDGSELRLFPAAASKLTTEMDGIELDVTPKIVEVAAKN